MIFFQCISLLRMYRCVSVSLSLLIKCDDETMTCEICVVVYCTVHFQLSDSLNECLSQVWYYMNNATVIYQTYASFHICPTMRFRNSLEPIDPKSFLREASFGPHVLSLPVHPWVRSSVSPTLVRAINHHPFKLVLHTLVKILSVLWSNRHWHPRSNVT